MNIREEVDKALDALPEEDLEGVLEYIRFISSPPESEPPGRDKGPQERKRRI